MTGLWQRAIAEAEDALRGRSEERRRALATVAELRGDPGVLRHPGIGRDVARLSALLEALGCDDEVHTLLEHVVSRLVWDPAALTLAADVRNELAAALSERGCLAAAATVLSTAVPGPHSPEDPVGPAAARSLANLAALRLRMGHVSAARTLASKASAVLDALDDTSRRHMRQREVRLLAQAVLCEAGRRQGDHAVADRMLDALDSSVRGLVRDLGGDHPASLSALVALAKAEFASAVAAEDQDRVERSADVLAIAAQKASATLGTRHPVSLASASASDLASAGLRRSRPAPERSGSVAAGAEETPARRSAYGPAATAEEHEQANRPAVDAPIRLAAEQRSSAPRGRAPSAEGNTAQLAPLASPATASRRFALRDRRRRRAGIRDVAKAAGVSVTTVSDALTGRGRLPDATRRHVREVADRLGYRTPAPVRVLRTYRSGLIGLAVTTYGDEPFAFTESAYFADMTGSAVSAALARGYALVTLPGALREEVWLKVALDGTVVIGPSDQDPVVSELVQLGVPLVSVGRPAGTLPVTAWVDNDHEAAVHGVLDHLTDAGARRIGMLTGTTTDTYTRASTTAYLRWCERAGQDPLYEAYPAHDPAAGAIAADRLLARPDRPDAVYGLFDPNGTDLLAAARRYRLRVPDDLLIVCCSESTAYAATEPPVTTLSLKPRSAGASVTRLLIDAIEGVEPDQPVEQVTPTELIVRASSRR